MTDTPLAETLQAADVAAYLKRHPAFLNDYPDLAAQLTMPREQGAVASLASYQLQHLREKNTALEQRLAELVSIAADNEQLMQRVHDLNLAVLRADGVEAAVHNMADKLRADFHTEQVRVLLFGQPVPLAPADWLRQEPDAAAFPEFGEFLERNEPVSGRLSTDKLQHLFGEQAGEIHSAALIPLDGAGIVAIGSTDENRFQPGMGTLFLKMIAATVSAALTRTAQAA